MGGPATNASSNQIDNLNSMRNLNARTQTIITDMKALSNEVKNGNVTSQRLQEIQLVMQDLQRDMEVMKQMEEALKKAMESINKVPQ